MSNEYTPDYSYVKTIFAMNAKTPVSGGHPDTLWEERTEQFDRWLEAVRTEAKAEALRDVADEVLGYDPRVSLRGIYAALKFRANQYK